METEIIQSSLCAFSFTAQRVGFVKNIVKNNKGE